MIYSIPSSTGSSRPFVIITAISMITSVSVFSPVISQSTWRQFVATSLAEKYGCPVLSFALEWTTSSLALTQIIGPSSYPSCQSSLLAFSSFPADIVDNTA